MRAAMRARVVVGDDRLDPAELMPVKPFLDASAKSPGRRRAGFLPTRSLMTDQASATPGRDRQAPEKHDPALAVAHGPGGIPLIARQELTPLIGPQGLDFLGAPWG